MLKELSVEHPYYCSESNYYSNEGSQEFETMSDFLDEFAEADVEMNMCFRWDIQEKEDEDGKKLGTYDAMVFLMLQRKGIFRPCTIRSVSEEEAVRFRVYAEKHWVHIQKLWKPISQ